MTVAKLEITDIESTSPSKPVGPTELQRPSQHPQVSLHRSHFSSTTNDQIIPFAESKDRSSFAHRR